MLQINKEKHIYNNKFKFEKRKFVSRETSKPKKQNPKIQIRIKYKNKKDKASRIKSNSKTYNSKFHVKHNKTKKTSIKENANIRVYFFQKQSL